MEIPKWVFDDIKNKQDQIDQLKRLLELSRTEKETASWQKQIEVTETLIRNLRRRFDMPDPQGQRKPLFRLRP
jgi:hypothetical protein